MMSRFFMLVGLILLPGMLYAAPTVTITSDPVSPAPFQNVTLTVQSYSFDPNTAIISWTVSGKEVSSGLGAKSITLQAGALGQTIPVSVKISTGAGDVIESKLSITPETVDILFESKESYLPPFYEGRSLPGEGAVITLTALPTMSDNGVMLSPKDLSYAWYSNNSAVQGGSGTGKQTISLTLDYLRENMNIRVKVRSASGVTAEKEITIYPHKVMPLLYLYDDLFGIKRENLVSKRFETTQDFTLALAPYYFSSRGSLGTTASYSWMLDSLPVTGDEKTILRFEPKENSVGSRVLSVVVDNTKRRLQKAESKLEILFDTRP